MSHAYRCQICSGANPHWHLMRRGDAVISWACDDHLVHVVKDLQRDSEITELIVTDARKAHARYQDTLDRVARDSAAAAEVDRLRDS